MNAQINLLHLKYFCDAVRSQSISEAAKMNFVTQSAVSQAISKLESCLKTSIVVHARQKFQVTEHGQILFEQSVHIFQAVEEIYDKINVNHLKKRALKFVSTRGIGVSYLSAEYQQQVFNAVTEKFPNVFINNKFGNMSFVHQALKNGEAEFAVVLNDSCFSQFNRHPLKKGHFKLFQHKDSSFEMIEKGILVDFHSGMYVKELCAFYSKKQGAALKIQMELSGWEFVARFTDSKQGIGFFPDFLLMNDCYSSLKPCPIEIPNFEYELCAIYPKEAKLSEAASFLLEELSTHTS